MISVQATMALAAWSVLAGPAFAADRAWTDCASSSPDRSISGCTVVLTERGVSDEDRAAAFYNRANSYGNKGDHNRTIKDYNAAIRLRPDFAGAFNNRGLTYLDKGDYDRAIADFSEAIRLQPDDAFVFYHRSEAYEKKGDHERAKADFTAFGRLSEAK